MSRLRVYIEPERIGGFVEIKEREIIHKIRDVLRVRKNTVVYLFDGEGAEYSYRIKDIKKKSILIEKDRQARREKPPAKKIILGFPVLREEKVDFILQKSTELGVSGFIPFVCARSIKNKPSPSKLERWRKIVIEAARQSERLWLPEIGEVLGFKEMAEKKFNLKIIASPEGKSLDASLGKKAEEIFLVVGPEGDFSLEEHTLLIKDGFASLRLSPHILRTETAAIFGAGLINYFLNTDKHK